MTDRYDAIVIGAGHNGLVCSALLAKAGKKVLVLEANARVGGAAITREFADGYSVSACAHLLYQLQPKVRKELGLSPKLASDTMQTVVLSDDGEHVRFSGGDVKGVGDGDVRAYHQFHRQMTRFADLLNTYLNTTPPRLGTSEFRDLATLARLGFDLRRLGRKEMRTFLRLIGINIHDEVTERFESSLLRGAVSFDAVLGTHLGPRSPNTIMTYLYRLAAGHGRLAVPQGGMGALSEELAHTARAAGVTIRTNMPVKRIVIENGRVAGAETAGGERFESLTVVSNADPKRTILELVGTRHVETGFTRRINNIRMRGNAAKLHLALDGLPAIKGLAKNEFGDRLVIAPDEHYVERAFNPATRPVLRRAVRAVRTRRWMDRRRQRSIYENLHRDHRAIRAGPRVAYYRERVADAGGHRERVPHHWRPLAPRRARAGPVHVRAAGLWRGAVPHAAGRLVPLRSGRAPGRRHQRCCRP
jgi:phytoene dehydrogenase-like protein